MNCTFEKQVIVATKQNQWTRDLQIHVERCPLCQETTAMTTFLQKLSHQETAHALPSYRLLWLKARYARKQEKLSTLDMVALIGMSVAGIAGLAGLIFWRFPQLFTGVTNTAGTSAVNLVGLLANGAPVAIIVGALATVWLLTRDSFFAER